MKNDHDRTLQRYLRWHLKTLRDKYERRGISPPDEDTARSTFLGEGVSALDLVTVKDFLRFYAATSHPPSPYNMGTANLVHSLRVVYVISFGAAIKEYKRLFYNDTDFLLAIAIADGALFSYDTLDDVRQQIIPTGKDEVILRFKDAALDRPILRKCTKAGGVTDDPMPKSAFLAIFKSTLINAGYL
ncbi:hypothetical protein LTR84_009451 [Exophiala bonariae]|uniref:Uncharacterized protein n=1 Tax=Exophiala bonariae TaxID=1690606 RepID=A0AAV9MXP5_9EURO|nr:hypothetical protein LTR84_009451 [Exophiala bonariae]